MTKDKSTPEAITDEALDGVAGGIALLVPAVQKVREAAAKPAATAAGDGSVKGVTTQTAGSGI